MKTWILGTLVAATCAVVAFDDDSRRVAGQGLSRLVLETSNEARALSSLALSPGTPALDPEVLRAMALDAGQPATQRIGSAEVLWLVVSLSGGLDTASAGNDTLSTLLDVSADLPGEPAMHALLVDALRTLCQVEGDGTGEALAEAELALLGREVARMGVESDPDNGFFLLFAAELALLEERTVEARDLLRRSANMPIQDAYERDRHDAALGVLDQLGTSDLSSNQFLVHTAANQCDWQHGRLLENVAVNLARADAVAPEAPRDLVATWTALRLSGERLRDSSLRVDSALVAMRADDHYAQRLLEHDGAAALADTTVDPAERALALRYYDAGSRSKQGSVARFKSSVHLLVLGWSVLSLCVAVTGALLVLRWPAGDAVSRRVRRRVSGLSPGMSLLAALVPAGAVAVLISERWYPFDGLESPDVAGSVLDVLADAPVVLLLAPLLAGVVVVLSCLVPSRQPTVRQTVSSVTRFFAGYAVVLLLLFHLTAGAVEQNRRERLDALQAQLMNSPTMVDVEAGLVPRSQ